MSTLLSQPGSAEKAIRKLDIAQVSLNLQDRLGLAKLKYQHGRIYGLMNSTSSDRPSDSSSDVSMSRCETPLTSPPLMAPYSKELPRSARNKHAVTFNAHLMQPTWPTSRKRARADSDTERPAKSARVFWKTSHQLPASSPGLNHRHTSRRIAAPFMSEAAIPEESSPPCQVTSDEENDLDLPVHSFQTSASMVRSSPPRTPPPKHARTVLGDRPSHHEDGADLLLYLANSPTPARVARGSQQAFPPSTPPSQHAMLPQLTPNMGTPGQQFNFADFVNVTPSPAQPAWGGRTPGNPARTPLSTKDARKRLNFDALVPPTTSSPRLRAKQAGLALHLGGELHP
ncbi:Uncharacterized protein PECH_003777 [Penicillium ucsense]|uniref:Uncharacterized protein n=1 Tax=Penicillium ucsense TaxID=2839758 RepID=A0A8J8WB43_9EURO|nr:Uncharacterized protein PECM_000031 [Penicillium ucsense]KAF7729103.1 Uncharacterized protein PECH_003777 [Penicillium ucsense]